MRYPTEDKTVGATVRLTAQTFGLTERALLFARIYAEDPRLGATQCAIQAGYASRCKSGAHVRAYELLHDPRVIRAIIFFSVKALNNTMAEARRNLATLDATQNRYWNRWDKNSFNKLAAKLSSLKIHAERLEEIYTRVS